MEYLKLVEKRRSYRKFSSKIVEKQLIDTILSATLTAPSSKSTRSSRFIVIRDKKILEQMSTMRSRGASFLKDAPMAIVVAGDSSLSDLWIDNCAISATLLQLAAEDLDLGSCWVHVHSRNHRDDNPEAGSVEDYLRTIIDIPSTWRISSVIALGHKEENLAEKKKTDDSDKIIFID